MVCGDISYHGVGNMVIPDEKVTMLQLCQKIVR